MTTKSQDMRNLMECMDVKVSLNEGRYWDNSGKYEDECNELQKLVPPSGPADTFKGEVLRALMKIYHDYYNNGFGNNMCPPAAFLMKYNVVSQTVINNVFIPYADSNICNSNIDSYIEQMMNEGIEYLRKIEDRPNNEDMWDVDYKHINFDNDPDEEDYY